MKVASIIFLLYYVIYSANAQDAKCLTPSPPMGWNSWNWHGKTDINEWIVMETIDAMVESGLKDAGYEYVVIDGGWRDTKLGENGELLAHPEKFPNGIKPLADYAHSKGLKFGLHTVPGTHDCGKDKVGGLGHEEVHIRQFVDWGLDFIKLDKCDYTFSDKPDFGPSDKRWKEGWEDEKNVENVYSKWSSLLKNCGRDIVFSISAYTYRDWYPKTCNMARTTPDLLARVSNGAVFEGPPRSLMSVAEINNQAAQYAGNCYWNDPDMMSIGDQGLTPDEQEIHFALWCIMTSPLMLGNDPRNMSDREMQLVTNKIAISINQDPFEQGKRIVKNGFTEIWKKQLSNGNQAILLLNRDENVTAHVHMKWKELGIDSMARIYDVFSLKEKGTTKKKLSFSINPRACHFLLIETD